MTLEEFADEYGFIADQVLRYHVLPGDAFSVEQLANEANARPGTCVCVCACCLRVQRWVRARVCVCACCQRVHGIVHECGCL